MHQQPQEQTFAILSYTLKLMMIKYLKLRRLIAESDSPTIVYVSRTKRTKELAVKLTRDGYKALPFNGKMESEEKIANQDAFMNDQVRIIVATSASVWESIKKMSAL